LVRFGYLYFVFHCTRNSQKPTTSRSVSCLPFPMGIGCSSISQVCLLTNYIWSAPYFFLYFNTYIVHYTAPVLNLQTLDCEQSVLALDQG
jgi:hypothetical protein